MKNEVANPEERHQFIIDLEKFLSGLNTEPKKEDIKNRQGINYIPVSNIEANLDRLFCGLWQTVNMNWQVVVNEIIVSIELQVFHPIAKVWITRTGVGAAQIRQSSGASVSDIDKKIKNSMEMDMPHAKADAIKNAAKSLGDLFGRNLSRKGADVTKYVPILSSQIKKLAKKNERPQD